MTEENDFSEGGAKSRRKEHIKERLPGRTGT